MPRIRNAAEQAIKVYVSACPQVIAPTFDAPMLQNFDAAHPQRSVAVDLGKVQQMADRSFQLLVGKDIGSVVVTQFVGTIPYSKAALHRHLYEEALIILDGEGMIWTEDLKTKVSPGDVVFLPSKQIHSLQCTDPQGISQSIGLEDMYRLFPRLRTPLAPSGNQPHLVQALLSEINPIGVFITVAFLSWTYDNRLMIRAIIVTFGLSLVVRALMPGLRQPAPTSESQS